MGILADFNLHSCQVSRNDRDSPGVLGHVPDDSTNVLEFSHKPLKLGVANYDGICSPKE